MELAEKIKIADDAIKSALSAYPNITITKNMGDPVEISLTIPIQPGIKHELWIALQNNDELTFSVDRYWYQWFPCTDPKKVKTFVDAVSGWISGNCRILIHNKGRLYVGSELQRLTETGWENLASGWTPCGLIFWKKTEHSEIRNI